MSIHPPKVKRADLSRLRMVAGNERRYSKVIIDGQVKEWVGIGWVTLREADEADYLNLPLVED